MNDNDTDALKRKLTKLQKVQKWCLMSEAAPRINAMIDLARSEPNIPILPDKLDANPWLLNCINGTLDLRIGTLKEHCREDYITKLCSVPYDANATCPTWEKFINEIMPLPELAEYLQRFLGYCLTGQVNEQYIWIFWGGGSNGKSTLLTIILEMFGLDYAMKAPIDFLMAKKGSEHPTGKADIFGKRLIACVETGEGKRLDEVFVKELSGGDKIRARRMKENYWEFSPTHKVILCTNHKPAIKGTDHAMWRRVRLVPFTVTIADDKADKLLLDKLRLELPGILAWAVRGCLKWQTSGLGAPDAVKAATAEYRSEQDVLSAFIEECCLEHAEAKCMLSTLYASFSTWTKANGEAFDQPISLRGFAASLRAKNFKSHVADGTVFKGLDLRPPPPPKNKKKEPADDDNEAVPF
jgi:putative DNA primase/helicase